MFLDGADAQRAIGPHARQDHADATLTLVLRQRSEEGVDRQADTTRFARFLQVQNAIHQRPSILLGASQTPARTLGGRTIAVWARVKHQDDVEAALANGAPQEAREHHLRALGIAVGIGHAAGTMEAIDGLTAVAVSLGNMQLASRLSQVVEVERSVRRLPRRADEDAMFNALVAEVTTAEAGTATTLASLADEMLRNSGTA